MNIDNHDSPVLLQYEDQNYNDILSQLKLFMYSLNQNMETVSNKLNDIEERLSLIEDRLAIPENGDIMTEQRNKNEDDITREEAKRMIIELFNKKKELDYIEIMSSLNLDLAQIVEICAELERENKIEGME